MEYNQKELELKEILEKHPNKKFIELAELGPNSYLSIVDLETFLSLDDTFLYFNDSEADFDSFDDFLDDFKEDFVEWLKENHKNDLEPIKSILKQRKPSFEIYSLNHRVKFGYSDVSEEAAKSLIDEFVPEYDEALEKAAEERHKKIEEYISTFKNDYSKATKVKDKDDILKKISAGLKTNFGVDSRSEPEYIKQNLQFKLE